MSIKAKILLVEDDTNLGFVIADKLKEDGYKVTLCTNGQEGLIRFGEDDFHLCLFDVMIPKKDGFSLARDIRKQNEVIPILFLTAKGNTEDRIEGFKAGGDDYLTKPFSFDELSLRVKALLKRVNIVDKKEEAIVQLGQYEFDSHSFSLKHPDFQKTLTKKEAMMLKFLSARIGQVIPREDILKAVWGDDDYFAGRSMDVFMTKLRKYFSLDASIQIQNIHGIGFKFEINQVI